MKCVASNLLILLKYQVFLKNNNLQIIPNSQQLVFKNGLCLARKVPCIITISQLIKRPVSTPVLIHCVWFTNDGKGLQDLDVWKAASKSTQRRVTEILSPEV